MPARKITNSPISKDLLLQHPSLTIMIILLIAAGFYIGMLTQKVNNLQQSVAGVAVAPSQPPSNVPVPGPKVTLADSHFSPLGDKNAKVTVIEFADFRCPYCEQFYKTVEPNLIKDYVDTGKIKFEFRQYAFLGPASTVAANAAECANEQNKFWEFHNYLYENQPSESDTSMYTVDNLTQVAGTLGLDTNKFQSCLSTNKYSSNVNQDFTDGQKAGVQGTPATFINGQLLVGAQPYATFKTIINQAIAKK